MNDLSTLFQLTNKKSRSISAENPTGEPGKGGMCPPEKGSAYEQCKALGLGWKANPSTLVKAGETQTIADIEGSGTINQIWITPLNNWRFTIIRFYWEDSEIPSVECPIGDFFCMGWQEYSQISSLAVCANPGSALNCYWQMPFKKRCRITLENIDNIDTVVHYQINYTLEEHPSEITYFHAQFRRVNPMPYKEVYTILDGVEGKGQYVGTYLAWGVNNNGWWGEGEIKFYIDDDKDFPTICGTGTEDYFCGSYNFEDPRTHDHYVSFSTPYTGLQVVDTDKLYKSQHRFGLYRFHIVDPIYFDSKLRITIQDIGWHNGIYLPLRDDIASVAFWYQTLPQKPFPKLPSKDELEII